MRENANSPDRVIENRRSYVVAITHSPKAVHGGSGGVWLRGA
jgi:hypothetical protein